MRELRDEFGVKWSEGEKRRFREVVEGKVVELYQKVRRFESGDKMVRKLTVALTREMWEKVEAEAGKCGVTAPEVVRQALEEYLNGVGD